ncbi:HugZ family protein [Oricola nitratireducens]|uniref:HugZ family pyridoxamine 5'-phosphate oxidase n=1 Tax=Oricola nitratireducens TaxID=2775868 RepID=UPI0018682146|nr:HugZ family protein [Oricola nitratireducens]
MGASEDRTDKPKQLIRETDDEAIRQARTLVATARHGALAVIVPESGFPSASRVALATDFDGTPVILVSTLSWHTRAIVEEPRCSLLVGEVGKGDPLAHPRISLFARARQVERGGAEHARIRRRYLARHPKAALYVDFGDFSFFRLDIVRASLNGGFGKAYELTAADLAPKGDNAGIAEIEESAIDHMNEDHKSALDLYARCFARAGSGYWRLAALDAEGLDLVDGDRTCRVWFSAPLETAAKLRTVLAEMAKDAREKLGGNT